MGDHWSTPGNIFSQGTYDEEFVRKFADPLGYLVKDLALISLTNAYLKGLPSTCFTMASVRYDDQQEASSPRVRGLMRLYADTVDSTPIDMLHSVFGDNWGVGHTYVTSHGAFPPILFKDSHPNPLQHYTYLKNIGMPLTDASFEYARRTTDELFQLKTKEEIIEWFKLSRFQGLL